MEVMSIERSSFGFLRGGCKILPLTHSAPMVVLLPCATDAIVHKPVRVQASGSFHVDESHTFDDMKQAVSGIYRLTIGQPLQLHWYGR
jgi:hypothetical protein